MIRSDLYTLAQRTMVASAALALSAAAAAAGAVPAFAAPTTVPNPTSPTLPVPAKPAKPSTALPSTDRGPLDDTDVTETPEAPMVKLPPRPFTWTPLQLDLPASIQVFGGDSVNLDGEPVKAWYALIDYSDRSLLARSILSDVPAGREPAGSMAKKAGALVAINGGYFSMQGRPAATYSVVISGGKLRARTAATALRPNGKYPLVRGAFGVRADRSFDFTWVGHPEGATWSYPAPLPNTVKAPSAPAGKTFPAGGRPWDVMEGIGGGPILLKDDVPAHTDEAEVLWGYVSTRRMPRTAVGLTREGKLLFLVTDGHRPNYSMGMTIPELTQTLQDLGCTDALNLDGGGSSTLVVRDVTLNKPSDGRDRNVTSILAIVPDPNLRTLDSSTAAMPGQPTAQ